MRYQRSRRKTLTPKQQSLQNSVDCSRLWADVVAYGLGEYMKRIDSPEDLHRIKQLTIAHLEPALEEIKEWEGKLEASFKRRKGARLITSLKVS